MKLHILALVVFSAVVLGSCAYLNQESKGQITGLPPAATLATTPTPVASTLPTLTLTNQLGCATNIQVEIARTASQLQTGLMLRDSLPEMQGMLFDFKDFGDSVSIPFYMKDTLIPLSIAFIDKSGIIIDIQDMEPMTETLHYPDKPYAKALEVNKGWFDRHDIKVGDKANLQ